MSCTRTIILVGSAVASCAAGARGVALSKILVTDASTNLVYCYDAGTGNFEGTFGEGSGLSLPQGIARAPYSGVFIANSGSGSVKAFTEYGHYLGDFTAPGSTPGCDQIKFGNDGLMYVSERAAGKIVRFDAHSGVLVDTFISSPALSGFRSFTFGPVGDIFAPDAAVGGGIHRFDASSGADLGVFAVNPMPSVIRDVMFGPNGDLYATSSADNVLRFNGITGAFIDELVPQGAGGLASPQFMFQFDSTRLFVASGGSGEVLSYVNGSFQGAYVPAGYGGLTMPVGLAFVPDPGMLVMAGGWLLATSRRRRAG